MGCGAGLWNYPGKGRYSTSEFIHLNAWFTEAAGSSRVPRGGYKRAAFSRIKPVEPLGAPEMG